MSTKIESLGVYLPAGELSTQSVLDGCARRIHVPLESLTGIRTRRVVSPGEYAIDLATRATERCFALSKYAPRDIDLLIACNISRYDGPNAFSVEPSTAIRLKEAFGCESALSFDVSCACAGVFAGILIADALIRNGTVETALLVSGEYVTHLISTAQREMETSFDERLACLTLGDAGVALTLDASTNGRAGFESFELFTLGKFSALGIGKKSDRPHGGAIMLTDIPAIMRVGVEQGVIHAAETLRAADWVDESFEHFIMHQVSEPVLRKAARGVNERLGVDVCTESRVVVNVAERGNTASTSYFVALWDRTLSGRVSPGDRIVFCISGTGQTVGTALYEIDELPDRIRQNHGSIAGSARRVCESHAPPLIRAARRRTRIRSLGLASTARSRTNAGVALALQAAENCLRKSSVVADDLDLLIFVGVNRDEFIAEPAIAALLAGALGANAGTEATMGKKTLAFDILNGSLGFLDACFVAAQVIQQAPDSKVMIVASEIENRPPHLRHGPPGVAETASAVILEASEEDGEGFGVFVFQDFVEHVEGVKSYADLGPGAGWLEYQQTIDLERVYIDCIAQVVEGMVERHQLHRDRLKAVCAPQISRAFLEALAGRLRLEVEVVVATHPAGGDLSTSSFPHALDRLREKTDLNRGDIVLVAGAAAGVQVCCACYYV